MAREPSTLPDEHNGRCDKCIAIPWHAEFARLHPIRYESPTDQERSLAVPRIRCPRIDYSNEYNYSSSFDHHASITALEESVNGGCDLCQTFLNCMLVYGIDRLDPLDEGIEVTITRHDEEIMIFLDIPHKPSRESVRTGGNGPTARLDVKICTLDMDASPSRPLQTDGSRQIKHM